MKKIFLVLLFLSLFIGSKENNIINKDVCPLNIFSNSIIERGGAMDSLLFGIDISHYQEISWDQVIKNKDPRIRFVIVRATMGCDRKDTTYNNNYDQAKRLGFIVGSYHYYDPNENPKIQAINYLSSLKISSGDILPVVDIEKIGRQSGNSIRIGLKNWLKIVEDSLKIKPIIYTSFNFYKRYLEKDFKDYYFWAAFSPSGEVDYRFETAVIYQFIKNVNVCGIENSTDVVKVDGNYIPIKNLGNLRFK